MTTPSGSLWAFVWAPPCVVHTPASTAGLKWTILPPTNSAVERVRVPLSHAAVNDILYRTLASAHIPSRLEHSDLNHSGGKRPDGVTMILWKNGRLLVWDATCPDTLAPSYRCHAASSAGAVATLAEERKSSKYSFLVPSHPFTPVAIESGYLG